MTSTGSVQFDGGRLFLEEAGEGPGVVLVHPGLWDRRTWDGHFERFAERYRVLRYDVRGYGSSSRLEPGRPYSHPADLVAVMDAAGMEAGALVGCSMGGAIALDVALEHPGRVTALVLAASDLGGLEDLTPDEEAEWMTLQTPVEEAVAAGELERAEELRMRIFAPLGTDDPAGARIRRIAFDNLHELTMDESGALRLDPPAIERLEEIPVPTLVLPADHDPLWLRRASRLLAERIPGARVVEIPDTDHVVNVRRPVEFDDAVLAFLGEVL
jgi:pimeloyl-ACP methyl ester carboxylesterase